MQTIWNIENYAESTYHISSTQEFLKQKKTNAVKMHRREEIASGRIQHNEIEESIETEWRGIAAERKTNY